MSEMFKRILLLVLAFLFAGTCFGTKNEQTETYCYLFSSSLVFASPKDGYKQSNSGLMEMVLTPCKDEKMAYVFALKAKLAVGNGIVQGEASSPAVAVVRDPENRRIVGGQDGQKTLAFAANSAMSQIKHKIITDNRWRQVGLRLSHRDFYPERINFAVKYQLVKSRQLGECVLGIAESSPYICRLPDSGRLITGVFKTVVLGSHGLHKLYLKNACFTARLAGEQITTKETYWLMDSSSKEPVDLSDIRSVMDKALSITYLSEKENVKTNNSPPEWSVHALAVREFMDIAAGAALEGRPNIVVIASIAGIMAVDALAGVGTELLSAASENVFGYKTPVWAGLTNYAGQGGGWLMAQGYSSLTGNQLTDEQVGNWMKIGGGAGDVAGLFIPTGAGIKLISKGGKWTWTAIKVADDADEVLRLGRYVLNKKTADTIGRLTNLYKKLKSTYDAGTKIQNLTGGIAGGVLLTGKMTGEPIRKLQFDSSNNEFIVNGNVKFSTLLTKWEIICLLSEVAKGDRVGVSMAGKIAGGVCEDTPVYRSLKKYDQYLGNIIYGRLQSIPKTGCPVIIGIKPSDPSLFLDNLCVCFWVQAKLKITKENIDEKIKHMACFLTVKQHETHRDNWELSLGDAVPVLCRSNFRHLQQHSEFYKKSQIGHKVVNYARTAAFARGLKNAGFDLVTIAEKLAWK
jgi:hypothetical protein